MYLIKNIKTATRKVYTWKVTLFSVLSTLKCVLIYIKYIYYFICIRKYIITFSNTNLIIHQYNMTIIEHILETRNVG